MYTAADPRTGVPWLRGALILLLFSSLPAAVPALGQMAWSDQFAGVGLNGYASGVVAWDGNLVFGGLFSRQGSVACDNTVRFDGVEWHGMGSPLFFEFTTFGVLNDTLYAHGYFGNFTAPDHLMRWNGTDWETAYPLADGLVLRDMIAYQGKLILAGGSGFIQAFDGTDLHDLGNNFNYGGLTSLAILDGDLYVGGGFESLEDGTPAHGLARWNGTSWSNVEGRAAPGDSLVEGVSGAYGYVSELAVHQGRLVLAGEFDHAGDLPAANIAMWDPATQLWSTMGGGVGTYVSALASDASLLYVGGSFSEVDGLPIGNLAVWDGAAWGPVGTGTEGPVYDLLYHDGSMVIAGNFRAAGGIQAEGLAFWDGLQFTSSSGPAGLGFDGLPSKALPFGGTFVVSGNFTYAGTTRVNNIARWTGADWTDLDGGLDGKVIDALIQDGDIVVSGSFTEAGGGPAPYVARWDGFGWSAVGAPLPGEPTAMTTHGGQLHVAGNPPGFYPPFLKRLDPVSGWVDVPLEPGVVYVLALGSYQGELFLGANVNTYYGPANETARHDGIAWQPVLGHNGGTLQFAAEGFEEIGGLLHILGRSFYIDGVWTEAKVGVWDGVDLLPLEPTTGMDSIVRSSAIVEFGGTTYLGAWPEYNSQSFWRAGPGASTWEPVEGGVNSRVLDLMEHDGRLLVVGAFDAAFPATGPEVPAAGFTWLEPAPSGTPDVLPRLARLHPLQPNPFNPATVIRFDIPEGGASGTLAVHDLGGRRLRLLKSGTFAAGPHEIQWNGRDDAGRAQASGVYLVRLETGDGVEVRKGMLVR